MEHASGRSALFQSEISTISGLCVNERHIVITNSKTIAVYKIILSDDHPSSKTKSLQIKAFGDNFHDHDCVELFIWDETIIVLGNTDVRLFSLGGVLIRKLELNDNEGKAN